MRLLRTLAVGLVVASVSACRGEPTSVRDLLKQAREEPDPMARAALVDRFIERHPTNPVIERNAQLTFFVKDDASGRVPRLVGDFNAWATTAQGHDQKAGTLTRIDGTSWSYLEGSAFTNARLEYVLLYEKETTPDPRNPRTIRTFAGERSEIRMPFLASHQELDTTTPVAAGTLAEERFESRALKASRRVWTYLPAGYEGSQDIFPTVYFLDGGNYAEWMGVPGVLDRLIATKRIPPVIAVFVEPGNRQEEYSRNPAWRTFIATELVPAIDGRYRTFPAPEQRLIFGSSLGAYGAVDLAVEHPGVFGLCAAIAPPAQASTLLTNQAQGQRAIHGVRFYVLGAVYDTDVKGARTLRTALEESSADVRYEEVPEGHAAETFRAHIDNALRVLLPSLTS
jgi:enterochelin esterase-like enzyme